MYSRILVALDHSGIDAVVLRHVTELVRLCGGTLVLYRVAHYHTRDSRAHEVQEAEEYLAALKAQLDAGGIPCETALGQGEPAHAISEDSGRLGCDLVVLGVHGHGAVQRFVLGSVAEDVKRMSHVPLLLVPGPHPGVPGPPPD